MSHIPHVEVSGTPHERGQTHGQQFADEIAHNAQFYIEYFAEKGIPESDARAYADSALDTIEKTHPRFVTEMRGVADGSGVPLEEVALINFRHTVLYSAYAEPKTEPDGCTSLGLDPTVTAGNRTYLAQNWDWKTGIEHILLQAEGEDIPAFIALTEAGMVGGKFGLNENGIGFCVNGLSTPDDGADPERKPHHVRGREILEATRLDEAVDAIVGTPRPTSRNYLIGRANGEIIDIETTPDNCYFLYPGTETPGVITHTNHFETQTAVESVLERRVPHSITRKARIKRLLGITRADKQTTEADIKSILCDHVGVPKSLCRHPNDDPTSSMTKASIILDLTECRMLAADGPPCKNEYVEYRF